MSKKSIDRRWLPLNALRAFEGVASTAVSRRCERAADIPERVVAPRHCARAADRRATFRRKPHALSLTKAGQHLLPAVVKSFDGSSSAGRHPQ